MGLNLRVTGYCNQGGRKYMEDVFSVAYQQTEDELDLEYAFFGIFDGHGGREAAAFAKEHLMEFIVRQKSFWSSDDESVLRAIHDGFVQTHQAMWKELEKWPKTASGLPSTAGTTASIAFIRRGKIYIGHVGDSAIVLGQQDPADPNNWVSQPLTRDHKPESDEETKRIVRCGGKVISKSGVPRVVWNRPRTGHKGPVRRSTHIDEIPFLAVARSLGDLWSYNSEEDVFVVSPEPDTFVYPIDMEKHRCLILGTDGAWNMLSPAQAVRIVCEAEKSNSQHILNPSRQWINPSKKLVDKAIERWNGNNLRADNTSVVTVMLDPPGTPKAEILMRQRELAQQLNVAGNPLIGDATTPGINNQQLDANRGSVALVTNTTPDEPMSVDPQAPEPSVQPTNPAPPSAVAHVPQAAHVPPPSNNLDNATSTKIISRSPKSKTQGQNLINQPQTSNTLSRQPAAMVPSNKNAPRIIHDFQRSSHARKPLNQKSTSQLNRLSDSRVDSTTKSSSQNAADNNRGARFASTASLPREEDAIQCNEISSSDDDSPADPLKKTRARNASTKKLSRELNNLQLDSPLFNNGAVLSTSRRNRRRIRSEDNHSDAENQESQDRKNRETRQSATADVEARCHQLKARIKNIERKVSKRTIQLTQEVRNLQSDLASGWILPTSRGSSPTKDQQSHFLRSQQTPSKPAQTQPTPRSLRPRTPTKTHRSISTPSLSLRKRKRLLDAEEATASSPAKSPKTAHPVTSGRVKGAKPVITRSKTARVLTLKK